MRIKKRLLRELIATFKDRTPRIPNWILAIDENDNKFVRKFTRKRVSFVEHECFAFMVIFRVNFKTRVKLFSSFPQANEELNNLLEDALLRISVEDIAKYKEATRFTELHVSPEIAWIVRLSTEEYGAVSFETVSRVLERKLFEMAELKLLYDQK